MADYYPYRIATRREDLTLIWRPGEDGAPDGLVVDDLGRLLAFHDRETLQESCDRDDRELIWEGEATLDLDVVRQWVEHPDRDLVTAGLLLDAWNFLEDLSHSLKTGPLLPFQGPIHDSAYEEIFGGEALEPTADKSLDGRGDRGRARTPPCGAGPVGSGRPWFRIRLIEPTSLPRSQFKCRC